MSVARLPPVFPTPPHMEHPSGLRVWLVRPLGVVTQLSRPVNADMDMARFLADEMNTKLWMLREHAGEKAVFVHDWGNLGHYSTEVRKYLTDWGIRIRRDIAALVVVLSPDTSALARMGISVAATALGLAGISLSLETDVQAVVRKRGLRPFDSSV